MSACMYQGVHIDTIFTVMYYAAISCFRFLGLQMILAVNRPDYISTTNDMYGVRLVVHSPYSMPFPEDDGVVLKPGQSTSIGIREVVKYNKVVWKMLHFIFSINFQVNTVKKGSPYGNCFDEDGSHTEYGYEKLYQGMRYTKRVCAYILLRS